jgi:PAS domain S-box-containing protein
MQEPWSPYPDETIALLRTILDSTPDGIVVTDYQQDTVFYNQKMLEIWRIDEEIFRLPLTQRTRQYAKLTREPEAHAARIFEIVAHPDLESYDLIELRDGRTIERISKPYKMYRGYAGRVWTVRDITERQKREKILRDTLEERNRKIEAAVELSDAIIENIPDIVYLKDARDHRITRINAASERVLGYSAAEMVGKTDCEIFSDEIAARLACEDSETISLGGKVLEIREQRLKTPLGYRILNKKKKLMGDEKKGGQFILGIAEDVTVQVEAREARERLLAERIARKESEAAIRRRDEFISIAAHELKTPLTALSMQITLLKRMLPDLTRSSSERGGKLAALMSASREQLDRFTRLVEDLLDVSRVSAGRIAIERKRIDLSAIVADVIHKYELEIRKSKCLVSLQLEPELLGDFDPLRIEQVVVNLLTNATKYGAGKPVEIRTFRQDDRVILEVRDHGIGVDPVDQERIFRRFERAVSSTTFGGFGLGLYITQQIVLAHQGTIEVQSAPGKGACFKVTLPL